MEQPDIKPYANGDRRISSISSSPQAPPKKRIRYSEPPVWARSVLGRGKYDNAASGRGIAKVNGKPLVTSRLAATSLVRPETNGNGQGPHAVGRLGAPDASLNHPSKLLGPWEESITGKKPFEQMTKLVADFLYMNVVSRGDLGELASRGVEIEIEAKLGQLIDKETNERYYLPVRSECVLAESARVGFRSSMTEACLLSIIGRF